MRTENLHTNLVKLSVIREQKRRASYDFGPVNPASTTLVSQRTLRENQLAVYSGIDEDPFFSAEATRALDRVKTDYRQMY